MRDRRKLQELSEKNIFLVGFMATGKSTVGKRLAPQLGFEFVDLDRMIVEKAGFSIPEIFSKFGEKYFRRLESEMVKRICARQKQVVAAGGGAVVERRNLELMQDAGLLICLEASPEVILRRVEEEGGRPLLETSDPLFKICSLLKKREPFYSRADFLIDTSNCEVFKVVDQIVDLLNK